jgi:hypothetical protein
MLATIRSRTITVLEIIHCPVFYLKYDFSKTGFCLRLQLEPTPLGPIDSPSLCLRTQAAPSNKPPMRIITFPASYASGSFITVLEGALLPRVAVLRHTLLIQHPIGCLPQPLTFPLASQLVEALCYKSAGSGFESR